MNGTPAHQAVMAARGIHATVLDDLSLAPDRTDETVCKRQRERKFMAWKTKVKQFSGSGATTNGKPTIATNSGENDDDSDDVEISTVGGM